MLVPITSLYTAFQFNILSCSNDGLLYVENAKNGLYLFSRRRYSPFSHKIVYPVLYYFFFKLSASCFRKLCKTIKYVLSNNLSCVT